jgi:methylated-DNA-[protein]-cysteine S-methyltransferase
MTAHPTTSFETAIGRCSISWSDCGVTGVRLPRSETRGRSLGAEAAAPPEIEAAIEAIRALLRGEPVDLRSVALDTTAVSPADRRVYAAAREIAPGRTLTYGEVAASVGSGADPREVGRALARNPFPIVVPCHRVVSANGKPGGFSAPGGVATKLRLLEIEGARTGEAPTLFEAARGPGSSAS